jgi:hypothetical protein
MTTHTVPTHLDRARTLSDDELLAHVRILAAQERGVTVELIAHLAEVEARDLHLAAGYPSMYKYCRGALQLSEYEAYHRIKAARAARRFPLILDRLAEGAVNLTTVRLLGPHLTAENHAEALESARGLSKSEVKRVVARLAPAPDVPMSVRKLPAPAAPLAPEARPAFAAPLGSASPLTFPEPSATTTALEAVLVPSSTNAAPMAGPADPKPAVVTPLSPDRYKMQLTIGGHTLETLELAKDMLRHAIRSGDEAEIIDRALTLLVNDLARKKFAVTERPRPARGGAIGSREVSEIGELTESRYIPAEVKRVVFVRDLGRCAFVGKDGHRCHERGALEFHHVRPYVEGGLATVDNVELRCRTHNGYEWRLRSSHVRAIEEEWLARQRVGTGSGPSRVSHRGAGSACTASSNQGAAVGGSSA